MRFAALVLVGMGLVGCGNQLAQDLYDIQKEGVDIACGCAVSEGAFAGTVAECRAAQGGFTQAQIDCLQEAFDNHASSADEDVVNCQIDRSEDALGCLESASCPAVVDGSSGCTPNLEGCGDVSPALQTAGSACL